MSTHVLFRELSQPVHSMDQTLATTTDPYPNHAGQLGVYNSVGSGKVVKIKRAFLEEYTIRVSFTLLNHISCFMTGTRTSGINCTDKIIRMDSGSTALASQVTCHKNAGGMTNGASMENLIHYYNLGTTQTLNGLVYNKTPGFNVYANAIKDASTKQAMRITVRAGEAFGIGKAAGSGYSFAFQLRCTFRNSSSGATYLFSDTLYADSDSTQLWVLENGSGSGQTLEILDISYNEIASSAGNTARLFTTEITNEMYGDTLTPVNMDSSLSLPSSIKTFGLCSFMQKAYDVGAVYVNLRNNAKLVTPEGMAAGAYAGLHTLQNYERGIHTSLAPEFDITLNEGEGYALIQKTEGSYGRYHGAIHFTVADAPSVGGVTAKGFTFA
jgi:hypothetical protein